MTLPSDDLAGALAALLALPRADQPEAVRALLARMPPAADEPWNSAFGPGSLYEAFTQTTAARGVHAANRAVLRPLLDARPGFRVVDVGGGAGTLWNGLLRADDRGEIVVVDPHPDGATGVRRAVPPGVRVTHIAAPVQQAALPDADAIVCSLMLHHVAGADAAARAAVGLPGAGKREVLAAFRAAITARGGRVLLNEADVYCDVGLAPGDPLLADRLLDSYVRRFAVSLARDLHGCVDPELRARWIAILRDWSLAQVGLAAGASYAERDVYELDVVSWLDLIARAGLRVEARGFTDRWLLFHQYVLGVG
ncbi:MAG: methyltransferase domain-containing protein [Pseudomonadota bacterium]|nr:methyltransferase domain-containing protein [Pseudomonadota bacterium]